MNKKNSRLFVIGSAILLAASGIIAFFILAPSSAIRVACVGDSLTQLTEYPYHLWMLLGTSEYTVRNYGAGATTVSLDSETPYMNMNVFQSALDFQPDIVIIMLGTNDAQPSLHKFNASFVGDYVNIVAAFQGLSSDPEIYVVLPPPIFSDQDGKMDPDYFKFTIIPSIEQAAKENDLPIIDVYSALAGYPNYFPDGVHANSEAAELIANEVYKAIISQNT